MKTIHIDVSVSYDVVIGSGLLKQAGSRIRELGRCRRAVLVSDDRVFPLYAETVRKSLEAEGVEVFCYVFPHGEQSKSMAVYEELLEYISSCRLTRSDLLLALGGGVVGDLTGFAAATYQRGIRFVQLPTTLLAAVDSSVGGKTAINLKSGKNQAGCFHQPSLVLCDTDTLNTLPEEEYRNGCAEIIKYGMLGNAEFFGQLKEKPVRDWVEDVIAVCVSMKRDIVSRDEFDQGERQLLNLGHTLGHGVEKCSHYSIPHGTAVAMGMGVITRSAEKKGICEAGTSARLTEVLSLYGLPDRIPYPKEDLAEAALSDKKNTGGKINLIVPAAVGSCVIKPIPVEELPEWMEE